MKLNAKLLFLVFLIKWNEVWKWIMNECSWKWISDYHSSINRSKFSLSLDEKPQDTTWVQYSQLIVPPTNIANHYLLRNC